MAAAGGAPNEQHPGNGREEMETMLEPVRKIDEIQQVATPNLASGFWRQRVGSGPSERGGFSTVGASSNAWAMFADSRVHVAVDFKRKST